MAKKTRRGYVRAASISEGVVAYNVEDADVVNRMYRKVKPIRSSVEQVTPIPIGAEVVVSKMYDEQWIIIGVLSNPTRNSSSVKEIKNGVDDGFGSFTLALESPTSGSKSEHVSVEYTDNGYDVDVDVEGEIRLRTGDGYGIKVSSSGEMEIYADKLDIYTDGSTMDE